MKTKLTNAISFLAISFSGAYKFVIVFLYSFFLEAGAFDSFSEHYFWLLAIWSLTGMPFSLLMSSKRFSPSFWQCASIIFISNILLSFLVLFFLELSAIDYLVFVSASLFASMYEIIKKDLLDREQYYGVFFSGAFSFVLLGIFIFTAVLYKDIQQFALIFSFFAIAAPVSLYSLIYKLPQISEVFTCKDLLTKFFQYSFSNLLSTSIGYFVPILLVLFLGNKYAGQIAEINSAARILLMIPIALAAKNIPKLKSGLDIQHTVLSYVRVINRFVYSALVAASVLLIVLYRDNVTLYWLMVAALLVPQFALPYSNLLAVEDKSLDLLFVNIVGVISLFIMFGIAYLFLKDREAIAFAGMVCLNFHFIIKYYLTRKKARLCLGAIK